MLIPRSLGPRMSQATLRGNKGEVTQSVASKSGKISVSHPLLVRSREARRGMMTRPGRSTSKSGMTILMRHINLRASRLTRSGKNMEKRELMDAAREAVVKITVATSTGQVVSEARKRTSKRTMTGQMVKSVDVAEASVSMPQQKAIGSIARSSTTVRLRRKSPIRSKVDGILVVTTNASNLLEAEDEEVRAAVATQISISSVIRVRRPST